MGELGYDVEWQLFNSKYTGVPQNRERIYTVGRLRNGNKPQIFPLRGTDEKDSNAIKIIGHRKGYRKNLQIFDPDGLTEALDTAQGGGREPHTIVPISVTREKINGEINTAGCLLSRDYKGLNNRSSNGVMYQFGIDYNEGGQEKDYANCLCARYDNGVTTNKGDGTAVCIPFQIPGPHQDGLDVTLPNGSKVYAVWYEKRQCYVAIRKLTPRECFRLQGWTDDYFEKAEFVNSDSQLYKQAGNGVTVNVVYEIGKCLN